MLFKLLLIKATFLYCVFSWKTPSEKNTPQARIVGGTTVTIEDVPFIVSIQYSGEHICGASIIKPNKIITAAHCTNENELSKFTIRAGSTKREEGGQIAHLNKIYQNQNFSSVADDYDLSILELDSNLTLSESVAPIKLPSAGQNFKPDTRAFTFGWGTFRSDSTRLAKELQGTSLRIIDKGTCQKSYNELNITQRMLCAGAYSGGKDSCQGDSGGPLIVDNVLAGITSFGSGCGDPDFPGIYTNVAALRDYIDKYL